MITTSVLHKRLPGKGSGGVSALVYSENALSLFPKMVVVNTGYFYYENYNFFEALAGGMAIQ